MQQPAVVATSSQIFAVNRECNKMFYCFARIFQSYPIEFKRSEKKIQNSEMPIKTYPKNLWVENYVWQKVAESHS